MIVDASVAIAWYVTEEQSDYSLAVLKEIKKSEGIVPTLWFYEITNVLRTFVKRKELTQAECDTILASLIALELKTMPPDGLNWNREVLKLALDEELSIYDASYLHLSLALRKPLATFDRKLAAAAQRHQLLWQQ